MTLQPLRRKETIMWWQVAAGTVFSVSIIVLRVSALVPFRLRWYSYALGKAHMRPTPSLGIFPNVAFETVPMFVGLTITLSRPFKEDRRMLPLSASLSSRRSINPFTVVMSVKKRPIRVRNFKSLCIFFFSVFFELACERIFIKTHSNESGFVI